jgi:D-alanyl-D-alanine carboxypeptidase
VPRVGERDGGGGWARSRRANDRARGYQLYGGRVLPPDLVSEMTTKGDGPYGLGTELYPDELAIGAAYGHFGDNPDHTSVLAVVPAKKLAAAMIFADGGRDIGKAMTDLTIALEPLLK